MAVLPIGRTFVQVAWRGTMPRWPTTGIPSRAIASIIHGLAEQYTELAPSSVYCSASPWMIEAMAREGIPVVGHLGMVPRHATWTNVRPIGKTPAEARQLYEQMKRLENAGAYAAEIELVPHKLASYLCKKTSLLLMSLGSGSGCDTQFLFSDDILQDYDERIPRHAKAYRNFLKEYKRLQDERVA